MPCSFRYHSLASPTLPKPPHIAPTVTNGYPCKVPVQNGSVPVPPNEKGQLKPLDYLQPQHELVQALGISAETAIAWESGFAAKGMMRGRYAVPIKSKDGELLGYVGIAVQQEQTPRFLLPNNLDPQNLIFAQDKLEPGTLYLVQSVGGVAGI